MFKVSWGKYYQRSSVVHQADARLKCVLLPLLSVSFFFAESWLLLAVAFGLVWALYRVCDIPLQGMWSAVKPLRYLMVFIALVSGFVFNAPDIAFFTLGENLVFGLSFSGANQGLLSVCQLFLFVACISLLSYTTPLVEISESLTGFLKPLEKVGFPAQDASLMTMLTLRFIPQAIEEGNRLIVAQKSRGLSFDTGSIISRMQAWLPIMVPLFVNTIRLSERTAIALEARCYQGKDRTSLSAAPWDTRSCVLGIAVCLAWFFVLVVLGVFA